MSRKCELLCRVFRIAPWGLNTNPNTTLVDHHEWLSPSRCPGLHDFHKLGLKLGENFPSLNTEEKKRKEMLFPKSTKWQLALCSSLKIYYQTKQNLTRKMSLLLAKTCYSLQSQSYEWLHSFNKALLTFGLSSVFHCLQDGLSQFMLLAGS